MGKWGILNASRRHRPAYQVTAPVLEFDDNSITIRKGQERWQLGRDSSTHVNGDLKVGRLQNHRAVPHDRDFK